MKYILLVSIYLISFSAKAQLYRGLDPSFGNNGAVLGFSADIHGTGYINNIISLPNGKIITSGVWRFNSNGARDSSFGLNGSTTYAYNQKILLQPDGKIIAAGRYAYHNNSIIDTAGAYRYLPNGTLDNNFANNSWLIASNLSLEDALLLADGKIMLLGYYGGDQEIALRRYLPNGTIDSSFGINGLAQHFLTNTYYQAMPVAMAETPDHRIVVGLTVYNTMAAMRFLPDGNIDSSFGDNGIASIPYTPCTAIAVQPDGKVLLAGYEDLANPGVPFVLARFNTDGSLDASFGNNGLVLHQWPDGGENKCRAMKLQPDGKIILAGRTWNTAKGKYDFVLLRYLSDGSPDTAFGDNGLLLTSIRNNKDDIYAIDLQADGKIVATGSTQRDGNSLAVSDWVIARYNANGKTGLQVPDTSATFELYPNPASAQIRIRLPEHDSPAQLFIYDVLGRIMIQPVAAAGTVKTIDISALAAGTYFLKASWNNGQTALKKIIKK